MGEVHHPEPDVQDIGHLPPNELTHPGHLAGRALDDLGNAAQA